METTTAQTLNYLSTCIGSWEIQGHSVPRAAAAAAVVKAALAYLDTLPLAERNEYLAEMAAEHLRRQRRG